MSGKRDDRVTAEVAAEASVGLWWSAFRKLAAEEQQADSPKMDLIERVRTVEDRLRLAIAARGDGVEQTPRPAAKKAKGPRLAKYKFVG